MVADNYDVRSWRKNGQHLLTVSLSDSDPDVWSGRAVQEVSSTLADAVLHYCIRPLIGASAPGHHGYQRAYDLILGQASNGLVAT